MNWYAHRPFAQCRSAREVGKLGQVERKDRMESPTISWGSGKKQANKKNLKEETCFKHIAGFPLKKSGRFWKEVVRSLECWTEHLKGKIMFLTVFGSEKK